MLKSRGRGDSLKKWGMGMYSPEDPLLTSSLPFARPPIQHFSVLKTLLSPQYCIFFFFFFGNFKLQSLKIREFSSKASNFAKLQFTRLHFVKKFSSHGSQIWQWYIRNKPSIFGPSGHAQYQNESWVPPPPLKSGKTLRNHGKIAYHFLV